MSLEVIFIFAKATNRTLVLPPEYPVYLLTSDKKDKHRGFADFYPLFTSTFQENGVPVISMEEFIKREGHRSTGGHFPVPDEDLDDVVRSAKECEKRKKSNIDCDHIFNYLRSAGHTMQWTKKDCIVFDEDKFQGRSMSGINRKRVETFCEPAENIIYFNTTTQNQDLIYFDTSMKEYRLLAHFYGYLLFTNPEFENFFKRFVRDYLHYHDAIYCAAGKIVLAIQDEGRKKGFYTDDEGGGGYSALHVRRGDLQYKKVKIDAEEWRDNLKDTWVDNEILYIATDERNKTFFDPLKMNGSHELRFLDDYMDIAGLKNIDPNYFGMLDTIVASRGRVFGGTYFSTFSGFIARMRGYHGMSVNSTYYGYLPNKFSTRDWDPRWSNRFAREWPSGWMGIDGNDIQSLEKY
mmetsp:Transcript_12316/g.17538  ORF Transcript_12316/g.17538 Transcript_12316/m.17538 type:complete len:406 (+) Transcript_12316:581-1798(+)